MKPRGVACAGAVTSRSSSQHQAALRLRSPQPMLLTPPTLEVVRRAPHRNRAASFSLA